MKRLLLVFALVAAFAAQAEIVRLAFGTSQCTIDTADGARVTSWKTDGAERLWMPAESARDGRWRHGGIPLCWPWLCDEWPKDAPKSPHGLAWSGAFAVKARTTDATGDMVRLSYAAYGLEIDYTIRLADRLSFSLTTKNASDVPKAFQVALHPYFLLEERDRTTVTGLDGMKFHDMRDGFDTHGTWEGPLRLTGPYDHEFYCGGRPLAATLREACGRALEITSPDGCQIVVWTPGKDWFPEGTPMYDKLPAGAWRRFASVEPSTAKGTIAPGETQLFRASFVPKKP